MNRLTAYVAGVVTALAALFGVLGFLTASAATPAAGSEPNALAAEFGLEIVWFDQENSPCGGDAIGCFLNATPDVVYIQTDLGDIERSVILHEIGHAVHYRLGYVVADECAADRFAESLGATWLGYADQCD